ncbi:MAG: DUF2220 family protein [Moritella sp.]|uniref:DUF7281 domain-containing protein n=1 Tax=Moritella sp. TaxID=78556 RepID=UPI0029A05B13|nr:hypothetical protein [Moritella sp.]MDX2319746.1 DUF2220 family protein [Moritella sp.]
MDINKPLYNACCKLVRYPNKIREKSPTTDLINELFGVGYYELQKRKRSGARLKKHFCLRLGEDKKLQQLIKEQRYGDIFKDEYEIGDRVQEGFRKNKEKAIANASQDIVLVNSSTGLLKLNQELITLFQTISCAGMEIRHNEVKTIEHDVLIICENFTPMYYLSKLKKNPIFNNALVLYRGEFQEGKRADQVNLFIETCRASLPIYYYGDMDPKGFSIAKSFNVDGILLPNIETLSELNKDQLKNLSGEDKYFPHLTKGQHSVSTAVYPQAWHEHIHFMNNVQLGLQQEHLLGADIDWLLYN